MRVQERASERERAPARAGGSGCFASAPPERNIGQTGERSNFGVVKPESGQITEWSNRRAIKFRSGQTGGERSNFGVVKPESGQNAEREHRGRAEGRRDETAHRPNRGAVKLETGQTAERSNCAAECETASRCDFLGECRGGYAPASQGYPNKWSNNNEQ